MRLPRDSAAVLFPGALGDFICFLPTLQALRDRHAGQLLLVAKPELLDLVEIPLLATASIDRREVADLFVVAKKPTPSTTALFGGFDFVYSWTAFGNPDFVARLAAVSGGRAHVFRFRGMRSGEHAADYYARCVGLTARPLTPAGIRDDRTWLPAFRRQHRLESCDTLVLHAGSGSPSKNWDGFGAVMRYWHERYADTVVLLRGPAEAHIAARSESDVITIDGLTLPQVAALLHACSLYLGNDSGISHLAGAVGARGAVLFGSSDPTTWAPRSDRLQVLHAPTPCSGGCPPSAFCTHRLPVAAVTRALEAQRAARLQSVQL
jgi:ADP-heptose:LPS heptosyltransferase